MTHPTVLMLGAAEQNRELVTALQRLGAVVTTADPAVAEEVSAAIAAQRPEFVAAAADTVTPDTLSALTDAAETGSVQVVPSVRTVRLTADFEAMRRLAADELGLPTVPFWFAGSTDELHAISRNAGFPVVVRPAGAPPGVGQSLLVRAEDVEPAWRYAMDADAGERVLVETVVEVDCAITMLAVRSSGPAGPLLEFCAPIGHRRVAGPADEPVVECWQPQELSSVVLDAARSITARVVRSLGGRGVFGVELLVSGDEVYFAGVNAQPGDTAWVTLRTQRLSAFELQARAVLGLAVDTIMISPGAARLTAADARAGGAAAALAVPESDVLVFGGQPPRRLAVATASDVRIARDRARQADAALTVSS